MPHLYKLQVYKFLTFPKIVEDEHPCEWRTSVHGRASWELCADWRSLRMHSWSLSPRTTSITWSIMATRLPSLSPPATSISPWPPWTLSSSAKPNYPIPVTELWWVCGFSRWKVHSRCVSVSEFYTNLDESGWGWQLEGWIYASENGTVELKAGTYWL